MKVAGIFSTIILSAMLGQAEPAQTPAEETAMFLLPDGKKLDLNVEPLKADPAVVSGKLDNGLTYFIRPNAEPKGRLSIRLRFGTGSLNEVEENQGIAHFIEHLVFNGSKHFKRGELMPTMQRHGLGLGGDANAYTSFDETVYMIDLPNLEEKTVDLAFTIMRDFGDGALLEESAINAERGIIESEYKARDSVQYRVLQKSFEFLLPGTKVPYRFPIGTLDFIRNGNRQLFLDYYQTQYIPSRTQLVLVGDITVEQAKAWIDKYFGSAEAKEYNFTPDWGKLTEQKQPEAKWFYNKELPATTISINKVAPYVQKKDTAAQRLEDMPLDIALEMLNLRLSRMTEKADCPFVNASVSHEDDLFKLANITSLNISTSYEQWKKAMTRCEQEVRRAVQFGFTPAELDEVAKNMVNAVEVSQKSWPTVKSNILAMGIVQSVASDQIFTTPEEDLRLLKQGIELLKQNPELCRVALAKVWTPENLQLVVSSNVENAQGDKEIMDCFKASGQTELEPNKEEETKPFAYDSVGEPGKIVSTTEIEDMGITQLVLSNGIRVNLKPTQFDKDSISIQAAIDGGEITRPVEKIGLSRLASAVMNGGGLEAHSDEELSRIMAGRTVGAGFNIANERFIIGGNTTPADLELQLKLIIAQAMHPGYRPEAEAKYRRMLPLAYKDLEHEPSGIFMMKGLPYLNGNDPRFAFPTEQQAMQWTTADVKEWIGPHLKNGYMEVSIVGDFNKDAILPVLERTLGALPKRSDKPTPIDYKKEIVHLAASGASKDFTYPSAIDRTLVCTVWKTGDGFDRERARRVTLFSAIVKERLFKGIREKMGEAYSPSVESKMSRTYPNLGYIVGICPGVSGNRAVVSKAVGEIAAELGNGKIDQDELDRARRPLLSSFEKDLRTNGYWMGVISNSQADPEDIEMARTRKQAFENMTLEEMNNLAKEIFNPENTLTISILPEQEAADQAPPAPEEPQDALKEAA